MVAAGGGREQMDVGSGGELGLAAATVSRTNGSRLRARWSASDLPPNRREIRRLFGPARRRHQGQSDGHDHPRIAAPARPVANGGV